MSAAGCTAELSRSAAEVLFGFFGDVLSEGFSVLQQLGHFGLFLLFALEQPLDLVLQLCQQQWDEHTDNNSLSSTIHCQKRPCDGAKPSWETFTFCLSEFGLHLLLHLHGLLRDALQHLGGLVLNRLAGALLLQQLKFCHHVLHVLESRKKKVQLIPGGQHF